MASYDPNSSLNLTRPPPTTHPYPASQSTNPTYQIDNAPQPYANQPRRIQFSIGESGSAPCGTTSIGVRIGCSQGDKICFSGEVVGGKKVSSDDVEAFRKALEDKVKASSILANSALQASTNLAPRRGMSNQSGKVTLASAAKVAAALGADYGRTAGEFIGSGLHHIAEFMTKWGDPAMDETLAGTRTRSQMARSHRLLPDAPLGRNLDELADPNFVPPEVGLPVVWVNPNGDQLPLVGRPHPSTTQTANCDPGPTTYNWSPYGQPPSQRVDRTGATTGTRVFAGAGTQYLMPQGGSLPEGSSNLGRYSGLAVDAFKPVSNAFDHFGSGTLTYMDHIAPNQEYRSLTGNLSLATSVSDENTYVPQSNSDSTPAAFIQSQTTQYRSPVSRDPWNNAAAPMS